MADKNLSGINVLMVIAHDQFRDEELLEPKKILLDSGANVVVASTKAGTAKGMMGANVEPDTTIDKVKAESFDAVVVIGGLGSPEHLWHNAALHQILQDSKKADKIIGAICLSGAVLANAGVIAGKRATVYETPESVKALADGKCTFINQPLVTDGNVVTANGPAAAADFGRALETAMRAMKSRV